MTTTPADQETMMVKGITWNHCVQSVTTALTKLGGISGVQVDIPTGRVSYTNTGGVPRERIAEAIRQAGYQPQ